ncbi:MAG TPA: hypothetical protein VFE33_26705 [Thermoanaerobaculia bacterium]|nr:hypothetical protein [Thermoanaerobaculia bacterium]
MLVHPMIAAWEPPKIERIAAGESRRLAVLPVAGLSGDLHQDLGRGALTVEIVGSLSGDEARDDFLKQVREKFLAGEPVDFVADIVKESELERVLIEELAVEELAGAADAFRYRIVLREYTEPPEPPAGSGLGDDFGAGLDADLDGLALSGLDLLDLPAIAGAVPNVPDILSPLKPAAAGLKQALAGASSLLDPLKNLLGGA